jgi:4'-phosphopantetheinyl transferase
VKSEEAHVWYFDLRNRDISRFIAANLGLLDPTELQRYHEFKIANVQIEYAAGKIWTRRLLSRYEPAFSEKSWQFKNDVNGKPFVDSPRLTEPLQFNLSHTEGGVAVALTRAAAIGVDIENVERDCDFEKLATKVFSDSEMQFFFSQPSHLRRHLFYEIWTLKEAYLKALGLGLTLHPREISFDFSDRAKITLQYTPVNKVSSENYYFYLLAPSRVHPLGIAVRCGLEERPRLRLFLESDL